MTPSRQSDSDEISLGRPIQVDPDPIRYAMALKAWNRRHRDCPGHYCRHDEGRPCPTPPAIPHFTRCPELLAADPRLADCGGCDECRPGHRCHLTGVADYCRGKGEAPEDAFFCWADYELISALDARASLGGNE